MNIWLKIKKFLSDLLNSLIKTSSLFKFALYNWITPLVIFVMISAIMVVPTIISYNSIEIGDITSNTLFVDQALTKTLSDDIKCSIKEAKLVCDEGYSYHAEKGVEDANSKSQYMVYVNYNVSDINFKVGGYEEAFKTDNYIIFFENYFTYRYTYRNPKDKSVTEYILYGTYANLEGTDFHKIYENSLTSDDSNVYLLNQSEDILLKGYKAFAKEGIYTSAVSNVGMYLLFILVISLLMKGNYLFKKKQGFKFTQGFKISIVASLQSITIALALSLFGMDLINMFGLSLAIRSIYIYIRYTGSKKNTQWLEELYELSKDERFNI